MKSFSIIGGDNRNLILSNLLEQSGYNVYRWGLGNDIDEDILYVISKSDIIILPTPFSVDLENLYCPLDNKKISILKCIDYINNKIVFAGNISTEFKKMFEKNNNQVYDFMKDEDLVLKNAIPTAEGVVGLIIGNTDITINDSNIAVLGFGRVGKNVSNLLNNMGAKIFAFDIKKEEVAKIEAYGYNILENICDRFNDIDIIINTVPQKILNQKELDCINCKTLIIDVSSKPGGVDFEYANKKGLKVIHALGLPGKVAPMTSAKYIKDLIERNVIKDEE